MTSVVYCDDGLVVCFVVLIDTSFPFKCFVLSAQTPHSVYVRVQNSMWDNMRQLWKAVVWESWNKVHKCVSVQFA